MQDDLPGIKDLYLNKLRLVAFFSVPVMLGMSVLSEYIVLSVLGDKWVAMVMILEMFGIIFLTRTLAALNGPIYLALGATKLQMYLTLAMRGNLLIAVVVGIQWGMQSLLWAMIIAQAINVVPAFYFLIFGPACRCQRSILADQPVGHHALEPYMIPAARSTIHL